MPEAPDKMYLCPGQALCLQQEVLNTVIHSTGTDVITPVGTNSVIIPGQEPDFSSTANFNLKKIKIFFSSKLLSNNSLFTDLNWEIILSSLELVNKYRRSPAISVHINHQDNR